MLSSQKGMWLGIIIGYANGRCAKGVMCFMDEDEDFYKLMRTDDRVFLVNKREIAALMYDVILPVDDIMGRPEDNSSIRLWYSDNLRKDGD